MKKMTLNDKTLRPVDAVTLMLSDIYESYGYTHFKMSKFEEYDLYAKNKEFLQSEGVITFMDKGRLLALKPDVTLSIIKNSSDSADTNEKYYYNESVYRNLGSTGSFGELLQIGVECIGDIGAYETAETVIMAKKSLSALSGSYVLDISHMGILSELLSELSLDEEDERAVIKCFGEKSAHGIALICGRAGVPENIKDALVTLSRTDGSIGDAVEKIKNTVPSLKNSAALSELSELANILSASGTDENIRLDLSVVCDGTYYNGIVFRGFIDGVPERVLSGGRYDHLMKRMGRGKGGIGFAVYADTLYGLFRAEKAEKMTDILILDDTGGDAVKLTRLAEKYISEGNTVLTASKFPENRKFGKVVKISEVNI